MTDLISLDDAFAYNPSQPRDAHGRWTSGSGLTGEQYRVLFADKPVVDARGTLQSTADGAALVTAVDKWVGDMETCAAISSTADDLIRGFEPTFPALVDDAGAILDALDEAPEPMKTSIYRGVALREKDIRGYDVGRKIDFPLGSFTPHASAAHEFADMATNHLGEGYHPVMFKVRGYPPIQGVLPIGQISLRDHGIDEILTGGRFEVVAVEDAREGYGPSGLTADFVTVELEQIENLSANV